jgi:hypothetical protein
MNTFRFYVYAYYEPGSDLPFYIGKGQGKRAWKHLNPSRSTRRAILYSKLRKMAREGIEPNIVLLHEHLAEEEAFAIERELIAKYGRRDLGTGCLCNHTDGGEGQSGSTALKGRKKTPQHREKLSAAKRGKKQLSEHVEKRSAALRGKRLDAGKVARRTAKQRQVSARAVRGTNLVTGEVKIYPALRDVEADGFRRQSVWKC